MAANEEVVRISYSSLEQLVFSSQPDFNRKIDDKSSKHHKSRRPAQQLYRPGQLRHSKGQTPDYNKDEFEREARIAGDEEEDWDSVDLRVTSTDEEMSKGSREGSGDVNDQDVQHRLDDLFIESPPRELGEKSSTGFATTLGDIRYQDTHTLGKADDRKLPEKGHRSKGRVKKPDIQIYVPKGRLGDREMHSEEKETEPMAFMKTENSQANEKMNNQPEFNEIVVSASPDSPRKVQKSNGGSMRVTVINEGPVPAAESSPTTARKELSLMHSRSGLQKHELISKQPSDSDAHRKQFKGKEGDLRNKDLHHHNQGNEKANRKAYETEKAKDTAQTTIPRSKEPKRQSHQKQDSSVKSYSKNRRSNSSDSRLSDKSQSNQKGGSFAKEQFSSDTFPRTKGSNGRSPGSIRKEVFSQNKNGKESKVNGREGEKFYWGMRRQRTGSISSEASVASNPSNGSFCSGSSDCTEDDEPEHILNWGEEVEKAHLEELARLVHDGAQKLTNSLDAYPHCETMATDESKKLTQQAVTSEHRKVSVDKSHVSSKEGRTRQRNRHKKSGSHHGSRDSSVHSSIPGEEVNNSGCHRRRRRRRSSHGSQGSFEPHHQQQHKQQAQVFENKHYTESFGDAPLTNRSGLQVTVGQNNRHVAINRSGVGRRRHQSDEKWDPHIIKDYKVDEDEDQLEREMDYGEEKGAKKSGTGKQQKQSQQQRWDKNVPPRFRKDSGQGRRGSQDLENYRHHGSKNETEGHRLQHETDQRHKESDQRSIHPAHDASRTGGLNVRGRGRKRGQGWKQDDQDSSMYQLINKPPGAAVAKSTYNHDDISVSSKTHTGGLLHLPSQPEPPRPHSNPNPSAHGDHSFHHDAHHYGASAITSTGSNTRGPTQGRRQLFDPKNPSRPIVISEPIPPPKFEDTDRISSPVAGPPILSGSPDSSHGYPSAFFPPVYGFRPPMPHFPMPPNPFMAGSIPPHIFFRFPRMASPDMTSLYNSCDLDTDGMTSASSKAQCRMMAEQMLRDSQPFDCQLGNILSRRPHTDDSLRMVNQIRAELQNRLEQVVLLDVEVANKHNVEQILWKSVYYQVIESYRRKLAEDLQDSVCKQKLLELLDEGTRFFENLLKKLQSTYEFDLEVFTDGNKPIPENVNRSVKLALLSAQRVMMFLGDIARYKEQSCDTTNYGKARHWYLKAQRIHPRNGRPYNQLAILAVYTRRKLDAVYYYMRSLAASNPILTARESLMSLFDEVRKKVDAVEKKRFEDRRQRQSLQRKRQHRGPRVEIWILPDGTSTQDSVGDDDEEEDLSSLSAIELNKRFVLTYLNVHGKLFTKINFEVFAESSSLMLQEFQTLIQHSPCVFSSTRLLQLMVINMFSVDNTALRDESLEENCRSLLQEHAVEIGLEMFGLLVKRSAELLTLQLELQKSSSNKGGTDRQGRSHLEEDKKSLSEALLYENPFSMSMSLGSASVVDEDLHIMLPALKTWVDWMMCHAHLWNPQPLNRPPELGPQIDVWKNVATFCDLLNSVETKPGCLIREQQPGYQPVILQEDTTLAGFVPMLSAPQEVFYADSSIDLQQAEDWLRIEKLRLFGEYLCGVEPPMLAFNVESGRYYSVAPSPTRSEEKLVTDSTQDPDSGEESEDVIIEHDDSENEENKNFQQKDDIEKLKAKKEELRKKRDEREKNKENMEAILDSHRHGKIELEIRPIFLIPDTNCFIDHFSTLKKILLTKKYTLVVPLVVINELDGLARGARDHQYDSPDHAQMVKSQARAAVEYLESEFEVKNPNLQALTSKGSVLETISFRSEESDGSHGVNDDIILSCCLHYCKDMAREFMPREKDRPVRLYREVVLLTDDRNLRLKAHTCNVPVKDVPSFRKWSRIS